MSLDLTSLVASINALDEAIGAVKSLESSLPEAGARTLRAGVIQHFEVAYELGWKTMRRWLENNIGSAAVDGVPRIELFRLARENRLIDDPELWMHFHRARNKTSHVYGHAAAQEVFVVAEPFLAAAQELLHRLQQRNA